MDQKGQLTDAFTRLELLACLAAVVAVLAITLPGLANTRIRTQQAGCVDNLRQIGQAVQLWAVDHDNTVPWQVMRSDAGTRPDTGTALKPGNAWFEFAFLSNFLVTPKILACPSDETRTRRAANNWGTTAQGGFRNAGYANNATSYTIGLHASLSEPTYYLSSDRNLQVDSNGSSCGPTSMQNVSTITFRPVLRSVGWSNYIHASAGNVLMSDGRVSTFSTPEVRSYLVTSSEARSDNGTMHILSP